MGVESIRSGFKERRVVGGRLWAHDKVQIAYVTLSVRIAPRKLRELVVAYHLVPSRPTMFAP